MSTPRDLVTQALGLSYLNQPVTANQENELRLVVTRALLKHWMAGVAAHPTRFKKFLTVTPVTSVYAMGAWALPPDAARVLGLTTAAGAPVLVTEPEEDGHWAGVARVGRVQEGYVAVDAVTGPVAPTQLVCYYARKPALPASLDDPLDALWPSAADGLLVVEVALYLAQKDGRADEVAALAAERDRWAALYLDLLAAEDGRRERVFEPLRQTTATPAPVSGGPR